MELKEIENSDVWIIIIYLFSLCFSLTFNNLQKAKPIYHETELYITNLALSATF